MITLIEVLQFAHHQHASDVRLSPHHSPWLRVKGTWRMLAEQPLTAAAIITLVFSVLSAAQAEQLRQNTVWPIGFGVDVPVVGRLRLVLYHHIAGVSAVFRLVSPPLDPAVCALPNTLWAQLETPGLVLLQGGKSSGRSTLASAFIRYLVQNGRHRHIMTLESPVEARYQEAGQQSSNQPVETQPLDSLTQATQTIDNHQHTVQRINDDNDHPERDKNQLIHDTTASAVLTDCTDLHTSNHRKPSPLVEQYDIIDTRDAVTLLQTLPRAAFDAVYIDQIAHYQVLMALMNCVAAGMTVIATSTSRSLEAGLQQLIDLFPPAERHGARNQLANCLTLLLHQTMRYPSSLSDDQRQRKRQGTSGPHTTEEQQDELFYCLCYQYVIVDQANRERLSAGEFDQLTGIKHGEIL